VVLGVGRVRLAAGPVEKINTSLVEEGVLGRLGVVGVGTGAGVGVGVGRTGVDDVAGPEETPTWPDDTGPDPDTVPDPAPNPGAEVGAAARVAVPATAVTDCASEQSSRGTGVWCEACTCITWPSRANANTEHDRVPNRAMNESVEYCGAVVRTTLPAATMAARNCGSVCPALVADAGGWLMETRTAWVDPVVTTYSQWSVPLPTAAVNPIAVRELISAAEGHVKTVAPIAAEDTADPAAPLPAGSAEARTVDLPEPDALVQAVPATATITPIANHHGVQRCIVSLPERCAHVSVASAQALQRSRCVDRTIADSARRVRGGHDGQRACSR
jgi:hypothetical protein